MSRGNILDALAARERVGQRVVLVAAHPDDETIGVGAQLCRFDNLSILHITDGAPRDGRDASNYGFASLVDYATARRREFVDALAAGDAHARTVRLDLPDQEACRELAGLTRRIAELLRTELPQAVITHAYEGGHPDHDAAAFAVHAACRVAADAPPILEMALYHRRNEQRVSGEFLGNAPETVLVLDADERRRKRRMIDSFATQRWLLMQLEIGTERLRIAPAYDFRQPPHPGTLHYETLGWEMTGERWRQYADAALVELGLDRLPCL